VGILRGDAFFASKMITAIRARSIALRAATDGSSAESVVFPFRRMPAMSTRT
jgi:hypothetical protein